MKSKWLFIAVGALSLSSITSALAAEAPSHMTSKGARFVKTSDDWTLAPNGLSWSDDQGRMVNLGEVRNWVLTDSKAIRACAQIGGSLPTKEQYEELLKYFETSSNGELTQRGQEDLLDVFPDMQSRFDSFIGFSFFGCNCSA